jgi:hypothetical protein
MAFSIRYVNGRIYRLLRFNKMQSDVSIAIFLRSATWIKQADSARARLPVPPKPFTSIAPLFICAHLRCRPAYRVPNSRAKMPHS